MRRCAACGYFEDVHDASTRKCPPETATSDGRRGSFRPAPPPDTALWPEIIRRDVAARFAKIEADRAVYVPPVVLPPQVPARSPAGPWELASYQGKQAVGLGRAAARRGWTVSARYWRAADGEEGCAVLLERGDLRAVATWTRPPGNLGASSGWSAGVAYGCRVGTPAARLNHTALLEMITNDVS